MQNSERSEYWNSLGAETFLIPFDEIYYYLQYNKINAIDLICFQKTYDPVCITDSGNFRRSHYDRPFCTCDRIEKSLLDPSRTV